MKSKIILSFIAIIFLSSCANKFSLTKRKYTKGYYFASAGNHSLSKKGNEDQQVATKKLAQKSSALPVGSSTDVEIKNTPVISFVKIETPPSSTQQQHNAPTKRSVTASASKKIAHSLPSIKALAPVNNNANTTKSNDSDLNLILMIILCLFPFINLIPVYLHDGKKVTLNFIITLILDFTWILGVVFAILVVLDVIDLK